MTEFDPKLLTNVFSDLLPAAPTAPQAFEEPPQPSPPAERVEYHGLTAQELAAYVLQNADQLSWEDYETLLAVMHGQPYFPEDLERIGEAFFRPQGTQPKEEEVRTEEEEEDEDDVPHYLAPMPAQRPSTPVIREPQVVALPPTSRVNVGAWWRKKK